jgi:hypothetical protein
VSRFWNWLAISFAIGWGLAVVGEVAADRARIEHLDGSGRATIIEVAPGVPGRTELLRATPEPIPKRGEVILMPRRTAVPSPSPARVGAEEER